MAAVWPEDLKLTQLLLQAGAEANARTAEGEMPLNLAWQNLRSGRKLRANAKLARVPLARLRTRAPGLSSPVV